ncbi:MAG: bifunctional nicotinamidase/pyrazinamidase [Chlamydiia bacterium]|nr:bifunctional nicotinamidase/pyrazinamidase [Chlamydiia bacterium]
MTALVIIDVQNDFLPGGSLPVPSANEIIEPINKLISHFDLVVATKDYHPENHSSFAKTHGKEDFEIIEYQGHPQELWPIHCVQETHGSEFPKNLKSDLIAKTFYKGTDIHIDSYSGFYDNEQKRSTGLFEYLQEKRVDTVYIVGLAIDYCVKYTVKDARALGLRTFVVVDCCRGIDMHPGDSMRALEACQEAGAHLVESISL